MERLYWVGTPHEIIMHDPMNADYHIGSIYQDADGKVGFKFCQDPFLVFVVAQNNLNGVVDTAEYFGFVGRSHFARYYKNEFKETPRQTLALRRKSELIF